jgi:simple sugar transport system ATP-binding protein
METILELKGITKSFPGVLANDHIDLTLKKGQIHALLGENGAGKSTLMNILYGLYQPDEGEIFYNGEKLEVYSPIDSINAGIGMVHQHFMLVPVFTVTENVMLGDESIRGGIFLDREEASKRILEISEQYNLEVDPEMEIRDLPVGIQQRVEIIKLLYREADVLILDEPTAVLTPQEVDGLFRVMRNLIEQGKSIIFITHKLKEVLAIADHFTVLRRGKVVGSTTPATFDEKDLASMMVGREVLLDVNRKPADAKNVVLNVQSLSVIDDRNQLAVDDVSFEVRAGEILGLAGVQGNGQTELVEALTGLRSVFEGTIEVNGQQAQNLPPRRITEMGVSHVPEDRQSDGLVLPYPLVDNLALLTYYHSPFSKRGVLQSEKMLESAQRLIENFDIRTPSAETKVGSLSGGNQQKVIVAREFDRNSMLVIASQPTRGLDVGSIEYIHKRLVEKRDAGAAVLLASTELDEILQLSDRIAVMYRGKIVAIIRGEEATKEQLGLLMAGMTQEQAVAG